MAAPMTWRKLVYSVYSPAITGAFTRISDRLSRARDRRGGSSVLLLAPLLAEVDPPLRHAPRPAGSTGARGSDGLCGHFQWMAEHVPAFRVPGTRVHVLTSPDHFYQAMKARIKTARRRVVMASLYLGTGQLEQELKLEVDCMEEALLRSQENADAPDLKVSILLDYTRGSRGRTNSRTMLLPLLRRFVSQMRVSLYHTPDLRGLLRLLVPQRFNETIGVQHIKVYLFDDSIIISGANLSDSYFTNRQDRYILLENCGEVADFFSDLVDAVGDVSLQLQPDDSVTMLDGMVHPYNGNRQAFFAAARTRIMEVVNTAHVRQQLLNGAPDSEDEGGGDDTWVFPLVQMKPLGIQIDEQVTQRLLTDAGPDSSVFLTSGYFNLTRPYMRMVLGAGASYRILTASPEVNGFFGAKGVAGAIPAAYTLIARQFYGQVCRQGQQGRVHLHEYYRSQWTFHAKGLWYYLRGQDRPCLTLIGSPNFGYRSVHRDLEAQIAIVTENAALQSQLQEEQETLYQQSSEVSVATFQRPDRHVKLWVKLVTPLIKNFF